MYAKSVATKGGCSLSEQKLPQPFPTTLISNCSSLKNAVKPTLYIEDTLFPESPKQNPKRPEITQNIVTSYVQPAVLETSDATLSADLIFELVNRHRAAINLFQLEHEPRVCAVAEARRESLYSEINITHTMHSGFYAMNLPYWATENMIYMQNEEQSVAWWLASPIHRSAVDGNYKYACGVCQGRACNMVFTNFDPKVAQAVPTQQPLEGNKSVAIEPLKK